MRIFLGGMALIGISLVSGCISSGDAGQSSNVPYAVESTGTQFGILNQQFQEILNATQYSSLLSTTTLNGTIPSVNFDNVSLVAVFSGLQKGCLPDTLSVTGVMESEKTITINVVRTINNPPPGTACTFAIPAGGPFVLISIPKSDKLKSLHIE